MWTIVLIGVCTALLLLVFKLIEIRARYASLQHYPGPQNYPLVGGALEMGTNPKDFLDDLNRLIKEYGNISSLWLGLRPFLLIADLDLISFMLSSITHIEKSQDYVYLEPWLGTGLLVSSGEKWKKRRKVITPAFHFKILEDFQTVFDQSTNVLVEKMLEATKKDVVDVYPYITLHALDVICETAMGTSVNAQQNSDSEYVRAVKTACTVNIKRSFSPWKQFDLLFRLSDDYRMNKKALEILHGFTNSIITRRRNELLEEIKKKEKEENDDIGLKKRFAFLDLLLNSTIDGQPLGDDDIREEVDTFMFEGHDTTASGMSFCLYNIANHPEVQEKIVEEIKSLCPDDFKKPLSFSDINQMKYLEMVIKESLRLYPSVPIYLRELKEDIKFNGTVIPKGTSMAIFSYAIQRNPEYFPDPEKFDPERFGQDKQNKHAYTYIAFSAGQRNCIGQKFAMQEMKTRIAKVLQHFKLSSAGPGYEPVLAAELVLKPVNGCFVKIKKRV